MKKAEMEKKITLVALTITIVVLLILASVAIVIIQNDGMIGKAQVGADQFNQSQENEQEVLVGYKGREGQTVQYDSNGDGIKEDWIVLRDRDGKVEIISKNVMGSLTLGSEDTEITGNLIKYLDLNKDGVPDDLDGDGAIEEGGTDLDGDGTIETDPDDIAIASYNNAITTINNYCKSLVTATNNSGVRSVGVTNNNYTAYHSKDYDNWGSKITVDVASTDESYKTDCDRMEELGITEANYFYWVASRDVYDYSSDVNFCVGYVNRVGIFVNYTLWSVESDGSVSASARSSFAVRPVVINPAGI